MEEGSHSQASVESPLGQLSGPTLAADMWGNSQSLHLHLTESTSSAKDSHPQQSQPLQHASQGNSATAASAQSQGFGESQDLRLFLTPSEESQPVPNISGPLNLSAPEGRGQQPSQPGSTALEKEAPKAGHTSPSHSQSQPLASSVDQSGRLGGSEQRAPVTVDLPLSQSQSASETTFKLERPNTSHLNPGQQTVEAQESTTEMSIFARTRLGGRHTKTAAVLSQKEESADFLMGKVGDSADEFSSDSIPCSQNRPPVRPESLARPVEEMEERHAENMDVYGNDTVMDSEPEEEEGSTQSYNVFPALSKSPAPPSSVMEEEMAIDDIEVPVLPDTSLAALKPPRPLSQLTTSQGHGDPASSQPSVPKVPENPDNTQNPNRNSQQPASQRQSQQATVQQVPIQETASHFEEEAVSQRQGSNRESERKVADSGDGESQQISRSITTRRQSQDVEDTAAGHQTRRSQQKQSQSNPSQPSQHAKSKGTARSVSSRRPSQKKKRTASVELSTEKGHSPGHNSGQGGGEGVGKETGPALSTPPARQLFHPQPDPYTFHDSQSQAQEGAENTSHAETTVSTIRMHTQRGGKSAWKRKKLVRKKNETNPHGEPEVTSPSTDETASAKEKSPKATKKGKKGVTKFTKLQKGRNVFKKPQQPKQKLATVPGKQKQAVAAVETEPHVVQPEVRNPVLPSTSSGLKPSANIHQQVPHAVPGTSRQSFTARKAGSSQETMFTGLGRKRRSVEFADVVQISSPLRPLSGEQSFSDSQSSDTMLEETHIREVVYRMVHRFVTVRRFDTDGKMVEEKTTEEKGDPVMMEENEISKKRKIYMPLSPSRSGSTLTSGDLGDISSSSLSNKTSSGPASLDIERAPSFGSSGPERSSLEFFGMQSHPSTAVPAASVAATAGQSEIGGASPGPSLLQRRSEGASESAAAPPTGQSSIVSPAVSTPNQSAIAHDESRHDAVVTSSSSGRNSDPLYSADNLPSGDLPCAQRPRPKRKSSMSSSPDVIPPTAQTSSKQGGGLRSTARATSRSTKRMAADSSQEGRRNSKGASPGESQVFQPGSESGGFSVHLSPALRKGSSTSSSDPAERTIRPKAETAAVRSSGGSGGGNSGDQMSLQVPVQETSNDGDKTPIVIHTASKLVIGAKLMSRWKDGFFYPATFRGLNTGIGNKFLVRFEDGFEKTVRASDIILAQHLPIGQSVLVSGEDDLSDPGMVINHVIEGDEVLYEVAMDNGSTKRCPHSKLLLTEDQASCLLSDEDLRVSFGEKDGEQMNTADVSLDNVILGKRLRVKGSPAVALPSSLCQPSTSTAASDGEENSPAPKSTPSTTRKQSKASVSDSTQLPVKGRGRKESEKDTSIQKETNVAKGSGRKRKLGPMATSTPTPKHKRTSEAKQDTPVKTLSECVSPLGAAVSSPVTQKRPVRKARAGLFEQNTKGPMPEKEDIFEGYSFVLTYIDKTPEVQAVERSQLKDPLLESSAEESTDEGGTGIESTRVPFDKDHLTMQIENGGGTVLSKFPQQGGSLKNFFVLSDTYHRTIKYLQALAANIPTVSHRWIIDSCLQNKLLDYKAYVLPAGIGLEKHKVMERTNVACLNGYRVLLTSSSSDYLTAWRSVLEPAQCKVVIKLPAKATRNRPGVDVMVTDAQCVPSLLKKAKQLEIPTVGSEWIIQCLINNTRMDFQGHHTYSHTGGLHTKGEASGSETK